MIFKAVRRLPNAASEDLQHEGYTMNDMDF